MMELCWCCRHHLLPHRAVSMHGLVCVWRSTSKTFRNPSHNSTLTDSLSRWLSSHTPPHTHTHGLLEWSLIITERRRVQTGKESLSLWFYVKINVLFGSEPGWWFRWERWGHVTKEPAVLRFQELQQTPIMHHTHHLWARQQYKGINLKWPYFYFSLFLSCQAAKIVGLDVLCFKLVDLV